MLKVTKLTYESSLETPNPKIRKRISTQNATKMIESRAE